MARCMLLAALALLCWACPGTLAYTAKNCVVTVTEADTPCCGRSYWSSLTHMIYIDSRAKLDALAASVAGCAATGGGGGGGGWRLR